MRSRALKLFTVQRISLLMLGIVAVAAVAILPKAKAQQSEPPAAIVIHASGEDDCAMPGADEDGNIIEGGLGETILILENSNKIMLKCIGTNITNDSGQAQVFEGFFCAIDDPENPGGDPLLTTDTHAVVTPSGRASMTCTFYP